MAAAAKAVAVADHKAMLDDHRTRVRDSHKLQMKELGGEPGEYGDTDMGDVFVCGDITTTTNDKPSTPSPATPSPSEPTKQKKVWPYVLAAALAGGGIGSVPSIIDKLIPDKEQPATVDTDTDTQYEVRLSSGSE